jgi:3D (Asp-Asp-Asp) domain-containing protein
VSPSRPILLSLPILGALALAVGCEGAKQPAPRPAAATAVKVPQPIDTSVGYEAPKPIGDFSMTFYYVIGEDEVAAKATPKAAGGAELASVATDPDQVTLYQKDCRPIASVSREFATQLEIQGTGQLRDGRVLNVWGACKCGQNRCFTVTASKWGTGGSGRPLQPFRTVAVDPKVIPLGSLLYVPLLEGRVMPGRAPWGGFVHDGCVVADDTGGHIDGNRLDLFVGRRGYFLGLSGTGTRHYWAGHVQVFDGSKICRRKGRQISRRDVSI